MTDQHYLTPDEVAEMLRCSRKHVTDLCAQGRLPAARFGGRWLIEREDVAAYSDTPLLVRRRARPARSSHQIAVDTPPGTCCVYVIESDYGVKVGITAAAQALSRLAAIESACGIAVRLIRLRPFPDKHAAIAAERTVHARLAETRMLGEWFFCHPIEAAGIVDRLYADTLMVAT